MTKEELIEKLQDCTEDFDYEINRMRGEDLLLQYINDEDIRRIWYQVRKYFWNC